MHTARTTAAWRARRLCTRAPEVLEINDAMHAQWMMLCTHAPEVVEMDDAAGCGVHARGPSLGKGHVVVPVHLQEGECEGDGDPAHL